MKALRLSLVVTFSVLVLVLTGFKSSSAVPVATTSVAVQDWDAGICDGGQAMQTCTMGCEYTPNNFMGCGFNPLTGGCCNTFVLMFNRVQQPLPGGLLITRDSGLFKEGDLVTSSPRDAFTGKFPLTVGRGRQLLQIDQALPKGAWVAVVIVRSKNDTALAKSLREKGVADGDLVQVTLPADRAGYAELSGMTSVTKSGARQVWQ